MTDKKGEIILIQPTYPSSPMPGPHLPVGLGYLAEQIKLNGIDYAVVDLYLDSRDVLLEKIKRSGAGYVGISLMSLDIFHNYALLEEIKTMFPEVKIIAGGPHVSFVKDRALSECGAIDFGVVHEGEQTLVELLKGNEAKDIKGLIHKDDFGNIIYNGDRCFIEDLDKLQFPRYFKFDLSRYPDTMGIVSSRGCPFSCIFCGAFLSMGRKWRARSAANIMEEILYWHENGHKKFNFVDSNFFMSKERVINLCDLLENINISITITSDGMRAVDADYEMLHKFKRFGLNSVAVGIESANDDILKNIKKAEKLSDIERGLRILKDLDISVVVFFIIGLPGETLRHVLNSFKFVFKYPNIESAYFFNPNPLPETELYKWAEENKFLRVNDLQQVYYNIGGMGEDILLETPELPLRARKFLYGLSKLVSKLVRLRHKFYLKMKNRKK